MFGTRDKQKQALLQSNTEPGMDGMPPGSETDDEIRKVPTADKKVPMLVSEYHDFGPLKANV